MLTDNAEKMSMDEDQEGLMIQQKNIGNESEQQKVIVSYLCCQLKHIVLIIHQLEISLY